jgi:hypothetical protein
MGIGFNQKGIVVKGKVLNPVIFMPVKDFFKDLIGRGNPMRL